MILQRKVMTSLSEAFIHLDMTGASRDIRRFSYVKKVGKVTLKKLITHVVKTLRQTLYYEYFSTIWPLSYIDDKVFQAW
jgi:hypothetical protein